MNYTSLGCPGIGTGLCGAGPNSSLFGKRSRSEFDISSQVITFPV